MSNKRAETGLMSLVLTSLGACLGIALLMAAAPGRAGSIIPIFPGPQDSPEYRVSYKNETDRDVNLPDLLTESKIVLDGKECERGIVKFGGRSNLHPKESWEFTFSPFEYLGGESLKPGKHEMSLKFGGKEFGPVEFLWRPKGELNPPK